MSRQHDLKDGRKRKPASLKVAELDPEQRLIEARSLFRGSTQFFSSRQMSCAAFIDQADEQFHEDTTSKGFRRNELKCG